MNFNFFFFVMLSKFNGLSVILFEPERFRWSSLSLLSLMIYSLRERRIGAKKLESEVWDVILVGVLFLFLFRGYCSVDDEMNPGAVDS